MMIRIITFVGAVMAAAAQLARNKMEIKVTIKSVYGVDKIYPACFQAKLFAEIAGTKTLTDSTIDKIKELGFVINVIQEAREL